MVAMNLAAARLVMASYGGLQQLCKLWSGLAEINISGVTAAAARENTTTGGSIFRKLPSF